MTIYLLLIASSIFVGLAAVLLCRSRDTLRPFLTAALVNAAVLLGIWLYDRRRRK